MKQKIEIPPLFSDRWFAFWEQQRKKTGNAGKIECIKCGKTAIKCYLIIE